MAVKNPTVTRLNVDAVRVQWTGIQQGDTCDPYEGLSEFGDRSVQFSGTFAATIALAGSNDGANFETLTDPLGVSISSTSADLKQIMEFTHSIKPVLTGGDGTTDIDVTVCAKRPRR
jgi:hypothetical protein